ncbi:MAG TPA: cold shock domain-containing protein [Candidatus Nanoarchaeia archaeon]|nr:cold shock domain-containing protein [Candidatus Nanoarchaeia archaeon]
MEGTVKFFNRQKGFGFISGDDGKDYFVHFTALPQGVTLRDNDRVSFEPAEGDRGLKAESVKLLEKASERSDQDTGGEVQESAEEESEQDEDFEEEPAEEE